MPPSEFPGVKTPPKYTGSFLRFMNPLLDAMRDKGGQARPREIYDAIAHNLNLSEEERSVLNKNGYPRFENEIAWVGNRYAVRALIRSGLFPSFPGRRHGHRPGGRLRPCGPTRLGWPRPRPLLGSEVFTRLVRCVRSSLCRVELSLGIQSMSDVNDPQDPHLPTVWIFQGSPKTFDIDGFLATRPVDFLWYVSSSHRDMRIGDQVFLWRAGGNDNSPSGVVAEAEIVALPAIQADDEASLPFWVNATQADMLQTSMRVRLRLIRMAEGKRGIIRRDWAKDDPILRNMTIIRRAAGTNFRLQPGEAQRLNDLWTKTGHDFSYAEAVAGLWAYHQTYGGEISRSPGQTVANVALKVGRAVTGIYNKVMNFRHMDPRDSRQGLSGAGEIDRAVWARFYDGTTINGAALEDEYTRLWPASASGPVDLGDLQDATLEKEARTLGEMSLDALLARYERIAAPRMPLSIGQLSRRFERSGLVVAITKKRANFLCEAPDCRHPTFADLFGHPYCEVHHIEPLADGGSDDLANVACLCPAHHREAHVGRNRLELRRQLIELRRGQATVPARAG